MNFQRGREKFHRATDAELFLQSRENLMQMRLGNRLSGPS